jgi:ArsR family transcriptional regulator
MLTRRIVRERCPPVLQAKLGQRQAQELAAAFRAIADPARVRLLSLIAGQPAGDACVCHFSQPLGLSQPTVSHHLKVLFEAGLVGRERRGTWVYYWVVPERLAALRDALAVPRRARARKAPAATRKIARTGQAQGGR